MKTTKKPDNKQKEQPPIGEGKANSAKNDVQSELEVRRTGYPRPGVSDKQYDNQPEFIDREPDSKEKD
jgi:hypothetical protein